MRSMRSSKACCLFHSQVMLQRRQSTARYNPPVRNDGECSVNDMKAALLGHPPEGLGKPDLDYVDQMPGSAIREKEELPFFFN